MYPLIATVT